MDLPMVPALDVLLIEHDDAARDALKSALGSLGCRTFATNAAPRAMTLIQARPFDLALIALDLPAMNGFEAARRIRALHQPWAQMPIAALVGRMTPSIRDEIAEVGMDAFLRKPVEIACLAETLALLGAGLVQPAKRQQVQNKDQADKSGDQFQREHDPLSPWRKAGDPNRDWLI